MYVVRPAHCGDVEAIARIHVRCWKECYTFIPDYIHKARSLRFRKRQWARTIDEMWRSKQPVMVLEHKDQVVGFANVKKNDDPDIPGAEYELHAAYFEPEHRGTLAGPMMLSGLLRHLRDFGARNFAVWVFANNPMRITYRQAGLKRITTRNRQLLGTEIPEIGMLADDLDRLSELADKMILRLQSGTGSTQRARSVRSRVPQITEREDASAAA